MTFRWLDDSIAKLLAAVAASSQSSSPVVSTPVASSSGNSTAIIYSLDRRVFEPLQEFPTIIRAAAIEAAVAGVTWADLTQPWSTYTASWDSFDSLNQVAVFLGLDDGTQTTWADLTNAWSSYPQSWNSFPAGGNVDLFSDNSTTDAGRAIPYSMVPALLYESSRQNVLLDSWEFYFKLSAFFELVTVEFDALTFAMDDPVPITAQPVDLSDEATFAISKAFPGPQQNQYARYIKVTLNGNSFYRALAFGGATLFVQIQERPSKIQPQS